jgi:enterochelin esterase-like enzyme
MHFQHGRKPLPFQLTFIFFILVVLSLSCGYAGLAASSPLGSSAPSQDPPTRQPTAPQPTATSLPTAAPTPAPTLTPTGTPTIESELTIADCNEKQGHIEPGQLDSDLLPEPLVFLVYLPPCYSTNPDPRYPVLYMLHGMRNNENQWVNLSLPATADRLITLHEAPPFIVVMPREVNFNQDPNESGFGQALVTQLIPWIDQHYATCTERICRAIGGLSRGSGWALRLGFTYNTTFGSLGMHSFSPFDGDNYQLPGWVQALPPNGLPRLYMDIGSYDISLQKAIDFEAEFSKLKVPHEWHLFVGYHNEDYWREHVRDYLRWYTLPWKDLEDKP